MTKAIVVRDVSKQFRLYRQRFHTLKERVIFFKHARRAGEFWALKDVSFEIEAGQTFGLIGANGSGKTTLLRLITGIMQPTSGEIEINGRLAALLELGAGFHPDLTGRENIYLNGSILGLSTKEVDRQFDSIVDFSELEQFIDNPVRSYSSGMYVRLGFAVAVHIDPDVLLIDEVLAVGDESFQAKCMQHIRKFQNEGRTIVIVTHAVDQVREMCNQAVLLDHGVVAAQGNPAEVVRVYREKVATTPTGDKVNVLHNVDIADVKLLDAEGRSAETFVSGGPMRVEVEMMANAFVKDPVFSVNIHDSAGQHVFGTNTNWRFMQIDLDSGPARLSIDFPIVPMREGTFNLTVGVHSRDGLTLYATTDRTTRFAVRSETDEPGRLFLPCSFAVEGAAVRREVS